MPFAVVTGASSGIGLEAAIALAENGYTVAAALRNLSNGDILLQRASAKGVEGQIILCRLDVTEPESINEFGEFLASRPPVDLLVNNAGYAAGGFVEEMKLDVYKSQFETNFFGLIRVTRLILPIMRQRRSGTIINIGSISGRMGFPGMSPYAASKYAVEGFTESLRLEAAPFGIKAVILEPGSFRTNIWEKGKRLAAVTLQPDSPYANELAKIEKYMDRQAAGYGDPADAAKVIVRIAGKTKPALRYTAGRGTGLTIFLKEHLPWRIWEKFVRRILDKS